MRQKRLNILSRFAGSQFASGIEHLREAWTGVGISILAEVRLRPNFRCPRKMSLWVKTQGEKRQSERVCSAPDPGTKARGAWWAARINEPATSGKHDENR